MDCLVISRQVINENMELCTKIAGALLLDKELTRDSSQLLSIYSFNELGVGYIICKNKPTESPLLYIQVHGLKKFTNNNEPFQDHILPTFIESALQAAADIWSGRREPAIDFDNSGLFYRRPKLRYGTPHP